ncbi:DUF397 domain-containing protein [Streptomyces rhizosphaerihabitans]|uniref:DUF397 domain-containing protein n=1 Tax=Streptomyces rhizosphaerihabitans TaxID=1266770 RepID=UPI0021BF5FB1|nr:DUF397 domain-containing protein [Streptomyces rhizosphaerihabitans]MCT9003691.1 DUF397 domain-containing protein [Streptomyces rhizosphaerihabitans]
MPTLTWQKSSYCPEDNSCVHMAGEPGAVRLTESGAPRGAILTAAPAAFRSLLRTLEKEQDRD